jgi:alpha-glucosidase
MYYGEEIGLRDVPIPRAEIVDPPARRGGPISRRISPWWNRDQARAPMPWGGGPNGGFSPSRPWLRMAPDAATRNVAAQSGDASSVLSLYRRLIWLRRSHPALQTGRYRHLASSREVFAYLRSGREETILVAVNFDAAPGWARLDGHPAAGTWTPVLGTHEPLGGDRAPGSRVELRPNEAIVFAAT